MISPFAIILPGGIPPWLSLVPELRIGLGVLAVCVRVYGRVIGNVRAGLGKVWPGPFGFPDVLVVIVLGSWLGGLAVQGFLHAGPPRELSVRDLVQSAVLFGMIVGGILAFLSYRRISIMQLFGFREVRASQAVKYAAGFLLAAYPLVFLCNVSMQAALGERAQVQEIMRYFVEAVQHSERRSIAATALIGVMVAPLLEELLFRGYIYGTLRRHLGPVLAMVISAALFSAIHVNVPALPALFVLAVCLTLAYEATGSLLVPMLMHAAFNGISLGFTYLGARSFQ